jgi:iron complex outermembrane receptor protein
MKYGTYDSPVLGGPVLTGTPAQIAALNAARLSILRRQTYEARDRGGSLSGRANLSYQLTDSVMGYASFARGFKSGGINMSGLPLTNQNLPALSTAVVKPERNTTYEVGIKTGFLDNRVLFNLTGFYTKVEDFQATVVDSSQTVALRGYLSNIPEVVVKGIEADAIVRPVDGLTLRGSLAYSHGAYTDYPAGPCPLELQTAATTACDLTGRPLVGLPKWVETVSADYVTPLGATRSVVAHIDSGWRSSYYGDPSLSRYTLIKGYNLTNASIGYRSNRGWEVSVFARNLFDADYIQNLTIQAGNSGLILGTPSDPRTVGVTLRFWQ